MSRNKKKNKNQNQQPDPEPQADSDPPVIGQTEPPADAESVDQATEVPPTETVVAEIPFAEGDIRKAAPGYQADVLSRDQVHTEVRFDREQSETFRKILIGMRKNHFTLANGRVVQTGADCLRGLVELVGSAGSDRTAEGQRR